MPLREHVHVGAVLAFFERCLAGEYGLEALPAWIGPRVTAIEGDVPRPVRTVLDAAGDELEYIRFVVPRRQEQAAVRAVLARLQAVIAASAAGST